MVDKLGNEIKVGDFIAYGCALGRSAGLQLGRVLGFKPGKDYNGNETYMKIHVENEQGTKTYLSFPDRCVVVSSMYDPNAPVYGHYSWRKTPEAIKWKGGDA